MTRAPLLALVLATLLLGPDPVRAAELRRVESVGAVPIQPTGAGRQPPRDGAVRAAVARGVEGVALDLLPEGWEEIAAAPVDPGDGSEPGSEPDPAPAEPGDLKPLLAKALGPNPFEYATRFRILEDRGERDALFSRDPKVESEYVVVVEAFVDAGRVRERLRNAGWISAPAGHGTGSQVRLVLEGLGSYGAYDALRRTLLQDLEVRSAIPVELSRGRAVLEVDGPYGAAALQQALLERADGGLRVVPLEQNGQTLTLLIDWTAPPASPAFEEDEAEQDPLADPTLPD